MEKYGEKLNNSFVIGVPEEMPDFSNPRKWNSAYHMYETFQNYIKWCDSKTIKEEGVYGKNPEIMEVSKHTGRTILGFCRFSDTYIQCFTDYERKAEYSSLCQYIRSYCSSQNLELAMAFQISPAIVSRIEGLVDKKEISGNVIQTVRLHIPELPPETHELNEGDEWSRI